MKHIKGGWYNVVNYQKQKTTILWVVKCDVKLMFLIVVAIFFAQFFVCRLCPTLVFNFNNSCCWLRCFVRHMFRGVALFVDGFNGWIKELG